MRMIPVLRGERVFITGCGGMLGNAVYPYFSSKFSHVLASDRDKSEDWLLQLDVRDDAHLDRVFREFAPNIVLHLAAETDLEYCETHPEIARETNSRAVATLSRLCRQYRSTLVYISTAGVFNGEKDGYYTEIDQPDPIMVYGRTKYEGEILAARYCRDTYVIRAGWMMGGGAKKEKKFIYKILQQIANGQREIFAVTDLWGTPTYTLDFARNVYALLNTGRQGIYHMVCGGSGTRFDVAREILRICRRYDIMLTAVDSGFFRKEYFVKRPRSEMMMNYNLNAIGCNHMRKWQDALREYIETSFRSFMRPSAYVSPPLSAASGTMPKQG